MNQNDLKGVKNLEDLRNLVQTPPELSPYVAKLLRSFASGSLRDGRQLKTLEKERLIARSGQGYVLTFSGNIALSSLQKASPRQ